MCFFCQECDREHVGDDGRPFERWRRSIASWAHASLLHCRRLVRLIPRYRSPRSKDRRRHLTPGRAGRSVCLRATWSVPLRTQALLVHVFGIGLTKVLVLSSGVQGEQSSFFIMRWWQITTSKNVARCQGAQDPSYPYTHALKIQLDCCYYLHTSTTKTGFFVNFCSYFHYIG